MIRCKKIISLSLVSTLCLSMLSFVQADEIEDKRQEKAAAEAQSAALSNELNTVIAEMTQTEADISAKQAEIEIATDELAQAKIEEQDQYFRMKQRIKYMYENGNENFLELIFQATDMADFINRVEYVQQITEADRKTLVAYQEVVEERIEKEEVLQAEEANLRVLQEELISKQSDLQVMLDNKNSEIAGLEGEISRLIAEAEEAARVKAEAEAAAAAAAARASAQRTQGGSPGAPVVSGSGQLSHPAPGTRVSSEFGPRWGTMHNGIDFAAPIGTPAYAAADGTVTVARYSSSAGNYVVINHGGGLVTKYMHFSAIYVSEGQSVSRGHNIGAIGNTGYSTGPHLHFQVEVNGQPRNPREFL
jgi:Membrane-bound metallopeptidase